MPSDSRTTPEKLRAISADITTIADRHPEDVDEAALCALITAGFLLIADQLEATGKWAMQTEQIVSLHRPLR